VQHIGQAFAAASAALLTHLTREAGLHDALAALKNYFLLARGDLFAIFMDAIEAELDRSASEVVLTRVQSLLELGAYARSGNELLCCEKAGSARLRGAYARDPHAGDDLEHLAATCALS
jgi:hypothetical protein